MTSRLMTTAACMLAILSAVCASHAAEMAQVSARRAVTEGSQGLYRDLCCESHHHVPTLVELLSGFTALPKRPYHTPPTHASPRSPCDPQPHRSNPRTTAVALSRSSCFPSLRVLSQTQTSPCAGCAPYPTPPSSIQRTTPTLGTVCLTAGPNDGERAEGQEGEPRGGEGHDHGEYEVP